MAAPYVCTHTRRLSSVHTPARIAMPVLSSTAVPEARR